MKAQWLKLAARIDALTLRERVLLFAAAVAVLVLFAYFFVFGPLFAKQAALRLQISQQQNHLTSIDGEITQKVQAYQIDPDAPTRARILAVKTEMAQLDDRLRAMQRGLVAPERITPLLESILRTHGKLQLVSMRSLQPGAAADNAPAPAPPAAVQPQPKEATILSGIFAAASPSPAKPAAPAPAKPAELIYRHGVELTVRGNYLDLVGYMSALEAMPAQLFWGKAQLDVEQYPASRLTLTLYTLSLDSQWMKL